MNRNKLIKLAVECSECNTYCDSDRLSEVFTYVMPNDVYDKLTQDKQQEVKADKILEEFIRKVRLLMIEYECKLYYQIFNGMKV